MGLALLIPAIVLICESVVIGGGNEIALIESVDGSSIPAGRIFAAVVPGIGAFVSARREPARASWRR